MMTAWQRTCISGAGVGLLLVSTFSAALASPPRRTFPATLRIDDVELRLNGEALCEWGIFGIDLYKAALYLEKRSRTAREIVRSSQRKHLELRFSRSLSKEQLIEAWTASFEVNAATRLPALQRRVDRLNAWMEDVDEGDSLAFTYLPGRGLRVAVKGRERGWIAGEDFARMFFTLYLGSNPPTEDVKLGLLGRTES